MDSASSRSSDPNNVAPMAMAGAYATVANNGVYCQPKAIDRVTDSDGNEIAPPATTCTQVIDPKVAATAAFALQGVMSCGGTGRGVEPRRRHAAHRQDRNPRGLQTWMIESSTKVATAVWVGNSHRRREHLRPYYDGRPDVAAALRDRPRLQRCRECRSTAAIDFPHRTRNLTRQVSPRPAQRHRPVGRRGDGRRSRRPASTSRRRGRRLRPRLRASSPRRTRARAGSRAGRP